MKYMHSEWRQRLEHWLLTLQKDLYQPLGTIPVEGFLTMDQLAPAEAAQRGDFQPMHPGQRWGRSYEYCWMRARIVLPEAARGKRIAMDLCRVIADTLSQADPDHAAEYQTRLAAYVQELADLDQAFRDTVEGGNRRLLVFGDRFPLLYFCREYGLDYRAAFHGCSGDTEPSLATLKYLIDKVRAEQIPVVYTIELSSQKVASAIAETTGARILTFHSCQTLTRQEFDRGETYLSLMWKNVDVLKEGLS